jgi:hypothetical protein
MIWLATKAGVDRKALVLVACGCARLSLVHVPSGEDRPRIAIETAERWARGDMTTTIDMIRAAYADADDAADDAYADANPAYSAAYAADAAAYAAACAVTYFANAADAAYAADAAAYAANPAYSADAAADAAYAAAAADADYAADASFAAANAARMDTRRQCADIARQHITAEQINRALNRKEYNESV